MLRAPFLIFSLFVSTSLLLAQSKTHKPPTTTAAIDRQAEALYKAGNRREAFDLYLRAANTGDPEGEDMVGWMYNMGHLPEGGAVPQDIPQGLIWIQKAADTGYAPALEHLGVMYEFGRGVHQDLAKALELFKAAAYQHNAKADIEVGFAYQNGSGVPQDLQAARMWYQKAINDGDTVAKTLLDRLNGVSAPPVRNRQQTRSAPQVGSDPSPVAVQQGTCAVIYIAQEHDEDYGTHYIWGAAWAAATLADAQSSAMTILRQRANSSFDSRYVNTDSSGCGVAHGAVAGKLKQNWQTGTLLGDGIYDVLTSKLADSTDEAISAAMSHCAGTGGAGGAGESCSLLMKW